jgi:hypothetical protein
MLILIPSPLKGARVRVRGEREKRAPSHPDAATSPARSIRQVGNRLASFHPTLAFVFMLLLISSGCATTPHRQIQRPTNAIPADAMITQRGVLTVLGRQFTLNGYLSLSATGGKRLIITENFGGVLADVLIKSDGTVHVMRSSRAFKPEWIRRYIAADVECLFGNNPAADCPGQVLGPNHSLIERRWYKLDLQVVETKPGPQPAVMFDESKAEKQ